MEIFWGVWLLTFLVVEGVALYRRRSRDTFSWQVWTVQRRWPLARYAVAALLIWLAVHFLAVCLGCGE